MKKRVKQKDDYSNEELTPGGELRYFHLYCDFCGARHPEKCVNDVYPEEGFPKKMDLCHDCQKIFYDPALEDPTKSVWFTKEYDPSSNGLKFKSDFNFGYDVIEHLLEVRTKRGYLKIDIVKKGTSRYYCFRIANFEKQIGRVEFMNASKTSQDMA